MKIAKLISQAIGDLLIRHLPQIKSKKNFAFLVHPRDIKDVKIKYPFLKNFSDKLIEDFLKKFWPITVSEIEGVYSKKDKKPVKGWVISCPITAKQMLENKNLAKKFIIKATKLAEKKGARIIGLGALTASLTRGGLDIREHTKIHITTGKLFTAKIVTDTTIAILKKLGLKKNIKISIVGAAGSIGSASAQILAKKGFSNIDLIDLSNKKEKIEKLSEIMKNLNSNISTTYLDNMNNLITSDLIIAATNRPDAIIKSKHLKPGAIVVDDAQPSDVDMNIVKERNDVLILEGGAANIPGVNPHFKFGLQNKEDIFSCLGEVIILTYSNMDGEYPIGEIKAIDFDILKKLEELSSELEITISKFQNFEKIYTKKEINFVKKIVKK